jgi:acetyl-CoA carboxylase biotin carboxyl carrier protein
VSQEIRAEMVANVWRVLVVEGAEVSAGDTLVILESMKMEIPVLAESPGRVLEVAVAEGDVVQEGDLIALLTDADAPPVPWLAPIDDQR